MREDLLGPSVGQESVANTIELTDAAQESLFFKRWTVRSIRTEIFWAVCVYIYL